MRLPATSPFEPTARPEDGTANDLKQRGLLSKEWREALNVVADGRSILDFQDAALDTIAVGQFIVPAAGNGSGCLVRRTASGQLLFAYPLTASGLLLRVGEPIDPISAAPPVPLDLQLSAAGLTALAAAIDFLRTLFAASLVQRQGLDRVLLRQRDLEEQVIEAIDRNDNRALVRLFRALLPSHVPCAPDEIAAGVKELADAGLLAPAGAQDDLWAPRPDLLTAALDLLSPLPAISLTRALAPSARANSTAEPAQLIFLRGNSLWQLDVPHDADDPARQLRLRGVDGLACLMALNAFLATVNGSGVKAEVPKATKSRKQRSRQPARPSPAAAGAALSKSCHDCGGDLKPGQKFCTRCGAAVEAR